MPKFKSQPFLWTTPTTTAGNIGFEPMHRLVMAVQKRPVSRRPRQLFEYFLDLPAELRSLIYTFACNPDADASRDEYERCNTLQLFKNKVIYGSLRRQLQVPAIAQASRQLRREALDIHYGSNVFRVKSFRSLDIDMREHAFGFGRIRYFVLERYLVFSSLHSRNPYSRFVSLNGVLLSTIFEISPDRTHLSITIRFPDSPMFCAWNQEVTQSMDKAASEVCTEVSAQSKKIEVEDLIRFDSIMGQAIGTGFGLITVNYVPQSARIGVRLGYNYHMLRDTWEQLVDDCVLRFNEVGF